MILVGLCLGIWLGIIIFALPISWKIGAIIIVIFLIFRKKYLAVLVGMIVGFIIASNYVEKAEDNVAKLLSVQAPIVMQVLIDGELRTYNQVVVVKPVDNPIRISLRIPKYPRRFAGDHFIITKYSLQQPENFSDFNYIDYLISQNIWLVGEAREIDDFAIGSNVSPDSLAAEIRIRVDDLFAANLSPDAKALLAGLVLGTKEDLNPQFKENLSRTGTSHIVAVSGYNVTLVLASLLTLAGFVNRKALNIISLVGLVIFGFIIGWHNYPAVRAVFMGLVFVFAQISGRRNSTIIGLVYAVTIMLIINPLIWKGVSFQLSVGAFIGLVIFARVFTKRLSKLPLGMGENVGTTLAVLITTLPITVGTFGVTSLISVMANAIILPLVPVLTNLGIVGTLGYFLPQVITDLYFLPLQNIADLIIGLINLLGELKFASTNNPMIGYAVNIVILGLFVTLDYYEFYKKLIGKE